MADTTRYSKLQITLHWLIAVLILATWWLGDGMGRALRSRFEQGQTGIEGNTWHVWLGGAVLLLVVFRIIVRRVQGAPVPVADTPPLLHAAGVWGHRLLYLLMVLAPLMGAAAWHLMLRDGLERPPITVTADFHVRLKRPTPSLRELELEARALGSEGPRVRVEAMIASDGKITATCDGLFVAVPSDHPAHHSP